MKTTTILCAAVLAACGAAGAHADTDVTVLRAATGPEQEAYFRDLAKTYSAEHEGVNVTFEFVANEAYKSKLPTLLQSDARPDLFYSWGGQTLVEQTKAGFTQDISTMIAQEDLDRLPQSARDAFSVDGKLVGLPTYATEVVVWVNTELTQRAGVDADAIKTWDDFLAAVETLKAAGITPISVGGQDKWPLHFYWSYLALREGGPDVITNAMAGEGDGFENAAFVAAGEDFQELIALDPFQPGFMGTTYETASGMFADGAAAFQVMGDWDYLPMRARSTSGEGLPDDQLKVIAFPTISDPVAQGGDTATMGGINGWAVSSSASPEAVDFLATLVSKSAQEEGAKREFFIPIATDASGAISNPIFKQVSDDIAASSYHQIFLDQYLGASVGATVNDISADLAQDVITPEDAAAQVQEAWDFR